VTIVDTAGGPRALALRLDGVALVGRTDQGPASVVGLALVFSDLGITIVGSQPGSERHLPWSTVVAASCGAPVSTPSGRDATPFDLTTADRTLRFLVDGDRVPGPTIAVLQARLARWAPGRTVSIPPGQPARPPASGPAPPAAPVEWWPPPPNGPPVAGVAALAAPPSPVNPYGPYGAMPPPGLPVPYGSPAYGSMAGIRAPASPERTRRWPLLAGAVVVLLAAVGLAIGLSSGHSHRSAAAPAVSADQHLADQLMLTSADLPDGWTVAGNPGVTSSHDAATEQQIDLTFTQCMGLDEDQAAALLGGQASDQTAQSSSPVFLGPAGGTGSTSGLELQTAAAIVRTHSDELRDFALFDSPKYPQCLGAMTGSEMQLSVNDATHGTAKPTTPIATVVALTAPAGEQVFGITISFDVTEDSSTLPVVVDQLVVGSDRAEGQLVAFGLGGPFPGDVLSSSIATFEHRMSTQGGGSTA